MNTSLTDQLENLLPQTQCTKCGYPSCHAYADAMARPNALHNQCPPGGAEGISRLAKALKKDPLPLNTIHGHERPRTVAFIEEEHCIGCTLCIQACPVDAILGAAKQMHTILPDLCTGCDLCVAPCPVDCITMINVSSAHTGWNAWTQIQANDARARFNARDVRLKREQQENDARLAAKATAKLAAINDEVSSTAEQQNEKERKQAIIAAAMERARLKKINSGTAQ